MNLSVAGASPTAQYPFAPYAGDPASRPETVQVSTAPLAGGLRRYELQTSQAQRDNQAQQRSVVELAGQPRVRSGDPLFDALFAMAVDDARLNAVDQIRDNAYHQGQPIPAKVFQTGEFWTYVWTRDQSYAADLGLVWFDPQRVARSLLFKTSGFRADLNPASLEPQGTQIVQDTGSGGSWPVSTDRVSWAWAAAATLRHLPDASADPARQAFSDAAFAALRGTVEADREAAFDPRCGLYGGEQSFLDWRTQTYAPWIEQDLTRMASSKALSTNVGHYQALRLSARLARERQRNDLSARYDGWADALALAIDRVFWLDDVQQYASMTSYNNVALHQFDMLGTALVVVSGIASPDRARAALAHYPHARFGVPVIGPQQPHVYVYHNRAIWPFVTGYALRAATQVDNPVLAQHAIDSLMRAAALHLSNMENLEWLGAKSRHDDGPAINSRRQLWSVGAYLGMVVETVFGVRATDQGLVVQPYLTTATRRLLGRSNTAELKDLSYRGQHLNVTLHLPPASTQVGHYAISRVRLDGKTLVGPLDSALGGARSHQIDVEFGAVQSGDMRLTQVPDVASTSHDDARVFAPGTPTLQGVHHNMDGSAAIHVARGAAVGTHFHVYRNGQLILKDVAGQQWTDPLPRQEKRRYCYAVQAVSAQGLYSHLSAPWCDAQDAIDFIWVTDPRVHSNVPVTPAADGLARATLRDWGRPGDRFEVQDISVSHAGRYAIGLLYNNHHQDIQTGVTATVKRLRLWNAQGQELLNRVLQMPNVQPLGNTHPIRQSTEVEVDLPPGTYRAELSDYFNMSYLASNADYAHAGGTSGALNQTHLAGLYLAALPSEP